MLYPSTSLQKFGVVMRRNFLLILVCGLTKTAVADVKVAVCDTVCPLASMEFLSLGVEAGMATPPGLGGSICGSSAGMASPVRHPIDVVSESRYSTELGKLNTNFAFASQKVDANVTKVEKIGQTQNQMTNVCNPDNLQRIVKAMVAEALREKGL